MELLTLTIAGFQLTATQLILLSLPLLYVIYTIVIHLGYPKSNPLVWSWVPHLRSAARFGADPNSFLLQCKQQYGDVFTVNLGGKKMTFVTNPECFPHITKGRDGLSFGVVGQDVAVSVLDQDRDFAADMSLDEIIHGQYSKYLTGVNLDELTERYQENLGRWFQQHLEREASGVHKGTVKTGLLDFCTRAIFSASTRAIFGDLLVDSSEGNGQAATPQKWDSSFSDDFFAPKTLLGAFQAFDHAFPLLYGGLPHFLLKKGVQARSNLIDAFRYVKNGASEFVEVDSPPTPRPNDQRNFAASQNGFQWAVQGNTIPACFWCVFYLLQNPAELKRVKDEIRTVMEAAKKEDPTPRSKWDIRCSRETLKKLTLLDCAIQETLRLATGSMMMRRSTKDQVLDLPTGPLPLKKGDNVAIYPYLQHHDPLLFPEPEAFQLDRWKEKPVDSSAITNVKGEKLTAAFLPFGSGISMCPGRHFARNEIKTFLVGFFSLFDLDEERQKAVENPGFLLSRAGLGIFPPSKDVEVTITHKNQK